MHSAWNWWLHWSFLFCLVDSLSWQMMQCLSPWTGLGIKAEGSPCWCAPVFPFIGTAMLWSSKTSSIICLFRSTSLSPVRPWPCLRCLSFPMYDLTSSPVRWGNMFCISVISCVSAAFLRNAWSLGGVAAAGGLSWGADVGVGSGMEGSWWPELSSTGLPALRGVGNNGRLCC